MPVKVEIKMDVESMAEFMLYHIYTSTVGKVALGLGVVNALFTFSFAFHGRWPLALLFLGFTVLILGLFPYYIRRMVTKQMESSKRVEAPVTYVFDETGVETITPEDSGKASWSKFKKAVSRKRIIILYDAKKQAVILPVDQIQEAYTAVVDMIYAQMPAPAVRIRRLDGKK